MKINSVQEFRKTEQALRASELIVKHMSDDLTDKEQSELTAWINASPGNCKLFNDLKGSVQMRHQFDELQQIENTR